MKTIWKYQLSAADEQVVTFPVGSKILDVQPQNGQVCLWALVDPDMPKTEHRVISIYGTGQALPEDPGTYVGTFQILNSLLVYHVFQKT